MEIRCELNCRLKIEGICICAKNTIVLYGDGHYNCGFMQDERMKEYNKEFEKIKNKYSRKK